MLNKLNRKVRMQVNWIKFRAGRREKIFVVYAFSPILLLMHPLWLPIFQASFSQFTALIAHKIYTLMRGEKNFHSNPFHKWNQLHWGNVSVDAYTSNKSFCESKGDISVVTTLIIVKWEWDHGRIRSTSTSSSIQCAQAYSYFEMSFYGFIFSVNSHCLVITHQFNFCTLTHTHTHTRTVTMTKAKAHPGSQCKIYCETNK